VTNTAPAAAAATAAHHPATHHQAFREEASLKAFTKSGSGPTTTFSLVLVSVTIAVLSMSMDAVPRYSHDAFFAGIALTILLAVVVGRVVDALKNSPWRLVVSLVMPTVFGAVIGMVVQAIVLQDVGGSFAAAVRDLGGLIDTTEPVGWIAGGIILGGLPALIVAVFLLFAGRAIRKLAGHDASEGFGVVYTGGAGLIAGFGLVLVDGIAVPPLFIVAMLSSVSLLIAVLVDGSRVRFLRKVYAGNGDGYDIVPADRFANDPSLAPMVANAGSQSVLVRVENKLGSYRAAAAAPIALVAETEYDTLRPLLRRRIAATAMLVAMFALGGLSALTHI
jgi:hypothetical protein